MMDDEDYIVTVDELKTLLKIKDIPFEDDDDYLLNLIDYKINELTGLLNVDLNPMEREYFIPKYKGNRIFLNFYPVYSIEEITINNKDIEDYTVNKRIGMIYLPQIYHGVLIVNYITRLSDSELTNTIKPLIMDMVMYDLLNKGKSINEGVLSSIHEEGVSVGYDTSSSLGNRIWTRIKDLQNRYSIYKAKVRLL